MCPSGDDAARTKDVGVDSHLVADDASSDRGSDTSDPTSYSAESVVSSGQSDSDMCETEHFGLFA